MLQASQDLDLDGRGERERSAAYCRACVAAVLAEDLLEEFACAVSDLGVVGKVRCARDEDAHAHDAGDVVQPAGVLMQSRQAVDGTGSSQALGLLEADVDTDPAGLGQVAVDEGELAADVSVVAVDADGDVGRDRRR